MICPFIDAQMFGESHHGNRGSRHVEENRLVLLEFDEVRPFEPIDG